MDQAIVFPGLMGERVDIQNLYCWKHRAQHGSLIRLFRLVSASEVEQVFRYLQSICVDLVTSRQNFEKKYN